MEKAFFTSSDMNSRLERHGRYQIEQNHNYLFSNSHDKNQSYDIDTYFFFPNSLNVTAERFEKKNIYQGLQRFFRLKAPAQLLNDLYATADHYLHELNSLTDGEDTPLNNKKFITKIKIFTCTYESSLRKRKQLILKNINSSELTPFFNDFYDQLTKYSNEFRSLESKITNKNSLNNFKLCDEYLSYLIRGNALKLLKIFDVNPSISNKSPLYETLKVLIAQEYQYAKNKSFPLPTEGCDNRNYIYRIKAILKKNIWNVLYLDIKRKEDTALFTHTIYGVAAGLSMIFATLLAFYAQRKFGNFSGPLFVALVVGYMFKDRIKDFLREFLIHLFEKRIFDQKTTLFSHDKQEIGSLKESISFPLKKNLAKKILSARQQNREANNIREKYNDESVILYQKRVHLNSKKFREIYSDLIADGIKDISRFDLSPFTSIMDNPTHYALSLDEQSGDIKKIKCLRSYHISILIHHKQKDKESLERYRVTMSRKEIIEIEKRLTQGQPS